MASSAANFRIFLRRRVGALARASPSPALLQPLFPGPYPKQTRSPLHSTAAAAAAAGPRTPAVRSSVRQRCRPCSTGTRASYGPTTLPWKPTNRPVMWGLKQVATTATNLPDKSCMQLSPPLMLSLIHHYSSKQPIDRKVMQNLKQGEQGCYTIAYNKIDIVEWFLDGLEKDLNVCNKMMSEALDTYDKGFQLLDKGLDSQAFAILEKVLDDILEGINASEKWLDYFATTIGNSKRLPPDMLELNQKFYKELDEYHKNLRQGQKKLSSSIKNLKKLKKLTKVLNAVSIGLGAYLLLLLMFSIGIY